MTRTLLAALALLALAFSGCVEGEKSAASAADDPEVPAPPKNPYQPHVVVGIPDSGINPYHELYYRPALTQPPCTYLEGFPCDLEPLKLTLGGDNYEAAFKRDEETWKSLKPGTWYWIPQTVFVAVSCENDASLCILDDSNMHGTGTTSSVIMENPDALIAFKEGGSGIEAFLTAKLPVDIFSVSWGWILPVPFGALSPVAVSPIYVKAAGNDPRSVVMDDWAGNPAVISVGGAYASDQSEEEKAAKHADVVSYYCRPTAQTQSTDEMRESFCGTSFSAPTVAGGLSKVILGLRQSSGYTGTSVDGMVDPLLHVSITDLRDAVNRTASYTPISEYPQGGGIPKNAAAPWIQWGWGFYDGTVAEATLAHLLKTQEALEKSMEAQAYMEALYTARTALWG